MPAALKAFQAGMSWDEVHDFLILEFETLPGPSQFANVNAAIAWVWADFTNNHGS